MKKNSGADRELSRQVTNIIISSSSERVRHDEWKPAARDREWHETRQLLMWETAIAGMNEILGKYDLSNSDESKDLG